MPRLHIPFLRRRIRHRRTKSQSPLRRLILAALYALLTVTSLLLIPAYLVYRPPHTLIRSLASHYPDVIFQFPTTAKVLALTIDDAPSEHTPAILRLLALNNATATFFVIGSQVPGRESLLTEILRQGHELANHGMYDEPAKDLSDAVLRSQITSVQSYITSAYLRAGLEPPSHAHSSSTDQSPHVTHRRPKFFRPGSGFFTTRMRALMREMGYTLALGSVYPHDAQIPFPRLNAKYILSKVRAGAVVVCHDRRSWTVPMLKRLLPGLTSRGYGVVALGELVERAGAH